MQPTLIESLNSMIAKNRAALEACDVAASRMHGVVPRYRVRELAADHLRRIDSLSGSVHELGGQPTRDKADLAVDRGELKSLDSDQHRLQALLQNESQLTEAYAQLLQGSPNLPAVERLVQRQYRRQRTASQWLRERVAQHAASA
ncbi:MAG: ferritin-like domain-containing protein [Myxococcales bacterium]|nr:ferritin-like domain-containing protein [Myxococcales bacterium]